MKKFLSLVTALIIVATLAAGCGSPSVVPSEPQVLAAGFESEAASTGLDIGIFQQVVSERPGDNVVISPLSLRIALAMAYNGAAGETKEAMAGVLGLQGLSDEEVNRRFSGLIGALEALGEDITVAIADSLWADDDVAFHEEFLENCRRYFEAEVQSLELSDPGTVEKVNGWVSDATEGRIEELIEQPFGERDVLCLINAIYFNAGWTIEFDPEMTEEADFRRLDDTEGKVQMMRRYGDFLYREDDRGQAVVLPYGDESVGMYLLLPREGMDYYDFVAGLSADDLDAASFQTEDGTVAIPRLELECDLPLIDTLQALGMGPAFVGGFDRMAPGGGEFFISEVKQKTYLKIDEKGTEAAAATSVTVGLTAAPAEEPFRFEADRPFVLAIVDQASGTPLFLGCITAP